jgi:N-acetylmuramoyl-L-alanine amidase
VALAAVVPAEVWACAVCFDPREENRFAFLATTIFLSLVPLLMAMGGVASAVSPRVTCQPPPCTRATECVVIDPGHPSEVNPGTHVINGISERDVNWIIARKLQQRLVAAGLEVTLTREDSARSMTNRERAEVANCAGPALFLRLHADAAPSRGFAVFYADREGRAQGISGPPLAVRARSERWARVIAREMHDHLTAHGLPTRGVLGDSKTAVGQIQGALTGSVVSRVPTVLVEMVVLTNAVDAAFIKSPAGQTAMVNALARGVLAGIRETGAEGQ